MHPSSPYDAFASLEIDGASANIANMTSKVESNAWVLDVDVTILCLTVTGALWILFSMLWMEFKGRPSTTRMRIVQSLVVSDLVLGIVGLVGAAVQMSGAGLQQGTPTCDGLGLMLVAVLFTEHLWTLTLAVGTFLILIHPLHSATLWLEKKWYYLWALVWIVSMGVGVLGYELYGYSPSGGICYYPTSSGLYGELFQFIPRGIVFSVITILYARLFVFLRRPDRIRSPYSDNGTHQSQKSSFMRPQRRKISDVFRKLAGEKAPIVVDPVEPKVPSPTSHSPTEPRESFISPPPPVTTPFSEIPPWERVELPAFQVDGQRFGGSSANHPAHSQSNGTSLWNNWKGMGSKDHYVSKSKRPSTASSASPPTRSTRRFGSGSSAAQDIPLRHSPSSLVTPRLNSISAGIDDPDRTPTISSPALFVDSTEVRKQRRRSADLSSSISPSEAMSYPRKVSAIPSLSPSFASSSQVPDPTPQDTRRPSGASTFNPSPSDATQPIPSNTQQQAPLVLPSLSDRNSDEEAQIEQDNEDEWDLMRVLQNTQPPKSHDDRFAIQTGGAAGDGSGDSIEFVQESMASYLNRKTALLMLWFPLGYVLLFSVSLIRLIYDFAGQPPVVLRAISRWMIFAQGILDALIYGLVEWHTKRVVRKRVKKGTFSPTGSRTPGGGSFQATGLGSALRGVFSSGGNVTGGGGGGGSARDYGRRSNPNSQVQSQTNSMLRPKVGQGATVSFGPIEEDPRGISQMLEGEEDMGRKGSLGGSSASTISGGGGEKPGVPR